MEISCILYKFIKPKIEYKIDNNFNIELHAHYPIYNPFSRRRTNVITWKTDYKEIKDMLSLKSLNLDLLADSDMISQAVYKECTRTIPFKKYRDFEKWAKTLPYQKLLEIKLNNKD